MSSCRRRPGCLNHTVWRPQKKTRLSPLLSTPLHISPRVLPQQRTAHRGSPLLITRPTINKNVFTLCVIRQESEIIDKTTVHTDNSSEGRRRQHFNGQVKYSEKTINRETNNLKGK